MRNSKILFTKEIYRVFFLCLVRIVLFDILIVFSTVILHEVSHFFTGIYFGCDEIKTTLIDFPSFSAFTEVKCKPQIPLYFFALTPLIFITIFGVSFLLLGDLPEKHLSWVIIGFNIIISISDLTRLQILMKYLIVILGVSLIIYGQIRFINRLINYYFFKEKNGISRELIDTIVYDREQY